MNISIIMPVIGSIGMIIISIILIIRSMEKRERIKSVDVAKFDSFAEEMRREIAEIKKDLQTVKEKVEVIDKMMKKIQFMENIVGDLKLNKYEDYINIFDALSNISVRIKIIGILAEGRQYVSELARLVNISRPLLYMHLKKLETARLVTSAMEISESGKAMKYYALEDFNLQITKELLRGLAQNIIIENPVPK